MVSTTSMASTVQSQSAAMSTNRSYPSSGLEVIDRGDRQSATTHASLTPRASADGTERSSTIAHQPLLNTHPSSTHRPANASRIANTTPPASTVVPSSDAASTVSQNYADSTILSTKSLLSHRRSIIQPEQQTTKGRKAFTIFCHALDVLVPIDISEDVTSMSESSIGKLGKAMQEKGRAIARMEKVVQNTS